MNTLTTYKFITPAYAVAVMDGILTTEFCLSMGLATRSTRPYTWTECKAQIDTGRGFGERERIR